MPRTSTTTPPLAQLQHEILDGGTQTQPNPAQANQKWPKTKNETGYGQKALALCPNTTYKKFG